MPKRKKLSSNLRYSIAFEQHFECLTCKEVLKPGYHIDHIIPLCENGTNDRDNLQAMCYYCHLAKTIAENKKRYQKLRMPAPGS